MKIEKRKPKRGQLYWEIIKVLGMTYLAGGGSVNRPVLPLAVKEIGRLLKEIRNLNVKEKNIEKSLKSLEKKEIVNIIQKDSEIFVHLKDKEYPLIVKYSIKSLLDFKKKKKVWTGKWFMVFFDIPEIQRNKRNYLRKFLEDVGFFQYQKSVYLYPFDCEKEINLIKKIVEGAKYMKYIIAEKIEDEKTARAHFNL